MANPEWTDPLDWEGEFVTFDVRTPSGKQRTEITIRLKQPICLYDEARSSPYFYARARAKRHGKKALGLHSCCTVIAEPRDWSNGVDELSAEQVQA